MKVRLTTRPEDYEKIGVKPGVVEVWEDGRRNDSHPGAFEWWYVDAMFDDGTNVAFTWATKTSNTFNEPEDHPYVKAAVTLPDGKQVIDSIPYEAKDCSWGKEQCDVKIGPHHFEGNLKEYTLFFSPVNGLGFDLKIVSKASPWRPGAGYFMLGDQEDKYFTWLCVCPTASVEGTMTYNGETKKVTGTAYHDHQWGTQHMMMTWNTWIWARQTVGKYTILAYDLTGNVMYDYTRYHLAFIQDDKGNIIFENFGDADVKILDSYVDPKLNKTVPGKIQLTYENNGKKVVYTLEETKQLEVRDEYTGLPAQAKAVFDKMLLQPSYSRLEGNGSLVIEENGKKIADEKGSLIYELAYLAKEWK